MDFQKLKLTAYKSVKVIAAPAGVSFPFPIAGAKDAIQCLLAFVRNESEVKKAIAEVVRAGAGTALVLAYPKGTSKKLKSDVNRDTIIAQIKKDPGFKAPKLVSLDTDWSGFMFKYAGTQSG